MARFQYGGQALIEGVLMRGRNALAVALRHPDGSILYATERLDLGLRARRALKLPFLRGLVVLYDTLVTGMRWLVRSATVQAAALMAEERAAGAGGPPTAGAVIASILVLPLAPILGAAAGDDHASSSYTDPDAISAAGDDAADAAEAGAAGNSTPLPAEEGLGKGFAVAMGGMLILSLALGVGIFFLLPLFLAQITIGRVDQGFIFQLTEGVIRVVIFIGYLMLAGLSADVRRTFQYHGAEHMSIHTLEAGEPLTVDKARGHPTAHPRCGTEFLVVVLIVSILAFALVGKLSLPWMIASRVILIPVIAAVSYEVLQLGARNRGHALVRWLWSPGIWVQKITTRQPTDDMIEVAIVSLQKALVADGNAIPDGSAVFVSRPLRAADAGLDATQPEEAAAPGAAATRADPDKADPGGARP
jgi:uncharacterized protein YqhQ